MATTNGSAPLVRIWVATLDQADVRWRQWLDDRELERLARFEGSGDQARFLLGAAMLRAALGNELGLRPTEVLVDRTCVTCGRWHGRPQVPHSALKLSVTHSGLVVAVAVARGVEVGLDVEAVRSRSLEATRSWAAREARLKAGGSSDLIVRPLAAPLPGYAFAFATTSDAVVRLHRSAELLAVAPGGP